MAFAQKSQAAGSTVSTGAWTLGLPEPDKERLSGNEAIVVESGKVVKIEKMAGVKEGLQMKFKTDQGNAYTVYMGPKWFIENQKLNLWLVTALW